MPATSPASAEIAESRLTLDHLTLTERGNSGASAFVIASGTIANPKSAEPTENGKKPLGSRPRIQSWPTAWRAN